MAQVDVNTCNAQQLTAIPGIEKQLATAIVRWRQDHGAIDHMEDLWHVDGMNRSKFQILRRHFCVAQQPQQQQQQQEEVPGTGAPAGDNPRCMRTSPGSFLCQGQSVHGGDGLRMHVDKADQRSSSPRRSVKHRLPQHGSQYSSCEELKKKTCRSQAIITGQNINTPRSSITSSNHISKTHSPRRTDIIQQLHRSSLDATMEQDPPAVEDQLTRRSTTSRSYAPRNQEDLAALKDLTADKPGFVLQPSVSGNNINVTCTIDKRLLSNLKGPMAIQLDQSSGKHTEKHPLQQDTTLRSLVDKMGKDLQATSDYATGTAQQTVSSDSGKMTSDEASLLNCLNLENLLRFDRCHRTTFEDRMEHVKSWVDEVNRSRPDTSGSSGKTQSKEITSKPITLIKPGYLRELVEQCDGLQGPTPVVKVYFEKKTSRGVRPTPTKTEYGMRDKSHTPSNMTDHIVSGTVVANGPMPRSVSAAEKRHISAVLRPPGSPRTSQPTKGPAINDRETRGIPSPPNMAMRYAVQKVDQSKPAMTKQSKCSGTTKSRSTMSKSQPVLANRKKAATSSIQTHKSGVTVKLPRTAQPQQIPRKMKHSLIRRVWDETQGQGQGHNGSLLRKPLTPPRSPSKGCAKGRHFLHQFSFVKPTAKV